MNARTCILVADNATPNMVTEPTTGIVCVSSPLPVKYRGFPGSEKDHPSKVCVPKVTTAPVSPTGVAAEIIPIVGVVAPTVAISICPKLFKVTALPAGIVSAAIKLWLMSSNSVFSSSARVPRGGRRPGPAADDDDGGGLLRRDAPPRGDRGHQSVQQR